MYAPLISDACLKMSRTFPNLICAIIVFVRTGPFLRAARVMLDGFSVLIWQPSGTSRELEARQGLCQRSAWLIPSPLLAARKRELDRRDDTRMCFYRELVYRGLVYR